MYQVTKDALQMHFKWTPLIGDRIICSIYKLFTHFRQLFVEEIEISDRYAGYIPKKEIKGYCEPGVLVAGTGGLVINVLADRLQIPIIVIRSTLEGYIHPFIPTPCLGTADSIIFVAHNVNDDHYFDI